MVYIHATFIHMFILHFFCKEKQSGSGLPALSLNEGPFSVFWPKSSDAEAVSAFPLRSLEVRCKLMNTQRTIMSREMKGKLIGLQ